MVANTGSESELAERLTEILERVGAGARLGVEREGNLVATIVPPLPDPSVTLRELKARFWDPPSFDDWEAKIWVGRALSSLADIADSLDWFSVAMSERRLLGESDIRILEEYGFPMRGA